MGLIEGILCMIGFLFVALYIQKAISKRHLKEELNGVIEWFEDKVADLEEEVKELLGKGDE